MFNKGSVVRDQFEKALETGTSAAKQSAQATNKLINPMQLARELTDANSSPTDKGDKGIEQLEKGQTQKSNSTPLDYKKLNDAYNKDSNKELDVMRKRLFDLVKSDEQKAIQSLKQEEEERKRKEQEEEQKKKQLEEQKKQQEAQSDVPHGKEKRSLFAPKKKAQESHQEVKANRSKG